MVPTVPTISSLTTRLVENALEAAADRAEIVAVRANMLLRVDEVLKVRK